MAAAAVDVDGAEQDMTTIAASNSNEAQGSASSIVSPSHHIGTVAVTPGTHSAKKSGRAKAKQKQKGGN